MSDSFPDDFDFSSLLPKRGSFKTLAFSVIRELTPEDITRVGSGSSLAHRPLQQIRAIHHRLAQLLSQGFTRHEVAQMAGSSTQRIDKLIADPTFQELIAYYQDQIAEKQIEDGQRIQEKLKTAAETALDELTERLEDDEKRAAMPTSELRKIVELGADRTVAPPRQSIQLSQPPTAITLNIGQPRFAELNAARPEAPKIIDANPEPDPEPSSEPKE